MKILFINPRDYLSIGIAGGIATMSAILKQQGHDLELFDTTFLKTKDDLRFCHKNHGGLMQFKETGYTLQDLVADDPIVDICDEFQKKKTYLNLI